MKETKQIQINILDKSWKEVVLEYRDWMTDGPTCQWSYTYIPYKDMLVIKRW